MSRKVIHRIFAFFAILVAISFALSMMRPDIVMRVPQQRSNDFTYEIADTPEEREQGLSGRASLARDTGLLFVFPEAGTHSFWMKDMRFPIDIIWAKEDGTIVGIERNVTPDTYPQTFSPPSPVPYVLEVAAGVALERGFKEGGVIPLP